VRQAWLVAAIALVALFVAQELLEGALLQGHVAGLAGVVGAGGWIALPLAVAAGGVVALAQAGAQSVLRRAASAPLPCAQIRAPRRARRDAAWRPAGVLARNLASRAPPAPAA
jgi:hypothetical protein